MNSPVRVRFAPSPTGYLHIGGARTALFNWLFARHHNGTFVLRIEDTDHARNTQEATQAILDGMRWLGLDWDEGPEVGGPFGPYYQSQRDAIYDKWFQKLVAADRVYQDEGAWRFRFERKPVTLHDMVVGDVTIDYRDESNTPDMVIRRSDGSYVFHFVNVVDDIEMKISHVIRGEDHVMNTPKHIQLFEALGCEVPQFGHIPLILNPDGSKMSKRDVGAALGVYPQEGFLPQGVDNFLALLGWSPKDDSEVFPLEEIVSRFSLDAVNRSPAKFDIQKCRWINQQHMMRLSPGQFALAARPFVELAGLPITTDFAEVAATVQSKVQLLSEVPGKIAFFLTDDYPQDPQALAKITPELRAALQTFHAALEARPGIQPHDAIDLLKATAKDSGLKATALMLPCRVALTGQSGGPDMSEIFRLLPPQTLLRRLKQA